MRGSVTNDTAYLPRHTPEKMWQWSHFFSWKSRRDSRLGPTGCDAFSPLLLVLAAYLLFDSRRVGIILRPSLHASVRRSNPLAAFGELFDRYSRLLGSDSFWGSLACHDRFALTPLSDGSLKEELFFLRRAFCIFPSASTSSFGHIHCRIPALVEVYSFASDVAAVISYTVCYLQG